jgi:hypothetical protein
MTAISYNGYLSPHVDMILQRRRDGASTKSIGEELYELGARSASFRWATDRGETTWISTLRVDEIERLTAVVRNILDKAGLLTPVRTFSAFDAKAARRLRNRPLDLGDDNLRDRWHIWGLLDQYQEFGGRV